jgi:Peptidase family C25
MMTLRTHLRLPGALAATLLALAAGAHPAAAAAAAAAPGTEEPLVFRLELSAEGVYGVSYEELAAAGLPAGDWASDRLALTDRGEPVPLTVDDGGDGRFGPGDRLELVGHRLAGADSFYDEYTDANVYWLRFDAPPQAASPPSPPAPAADAAPARDALEVREHFEEDRLLLRFGPDADSTMSDSWYWAKLTHLDDKPFTVSFDLADRDATSPRPLALRVQLRGWSKQKDKTDPPLPDHHVELLLNGQPIGAAEWDGQLAYTVEIPAIPADALRPGANVLALRVPVRRPKEGADPVIDVTMLNWVEIRYPRAAALGAAQAVVHLADGAGPQVVGLTTAAKTGLQVFAGDGRRLATTDETSGGRRLHLVPVPAGESTLYAVPAGALRSLDGVARGHLPHLRERTAQVDYLIIAHPSLIDAVEPLAAFHRRRGLTVEVVDVDEIYDAFSGGIVDPRAIRDFIADAYRRRPKPAPRFVLLVGDASWDPKNLQADDDNYADWTYRAGETTRFVKNGSTPYARSERGQRDLVPTWHYRSFEGHAASDNWFVSVDGDDFAPDLAIGRFPVATPAEVSAIVEKTIRYAESADVGPWRRRILWITNEQSNYQMLSDRLADRYARLGFEPSRVYPGPEPPAGTTHRDVLLHALAEGNLVVHFFGHGGRYIWRTAAADLHHQSDLFTLEDVDRLPATDRLPIVLSMTCYSAPFDHPTADSIGEKLLRAPERGAVAVLAASWRNVPTIDFSQLVLDEMIRPGTLGEAIERAKAKATREEPVQMYNLLGDPALPLATPRLAVRLADAATANALAVDAEVPSPDFHGAARIDWLSEKGAVVKSEEVAVAGPRFALTFAGTPEQRQAVRALEVYVWNAADGLDGVGGLTLAADGTDQSAFLQNQ